MRRSINDEMLCKDFKKSVEKYWPDVYERKVQLIRFRNAWDQGQSRKSRGTKSISIQVDKGVKEQFSEMVKFHRVTQAEFISELLSFFNQPQGQVDLFSTAEARKQSRSEVDDYLNEIKELKLLLDDRDEEIKQLEVQLSKAQACDSIGDAKLSNKSTKQERQLAFEKMLEENIPDLSSKRKPK